MWFNDLELSWEKFHLFINGRIDGNIFQFIRKVFNIFFRPNDHRLLTMYLYVSHLVALIRADYGFDTF